MEVKKSPKADLEGKKTQWLLIGYVVVLAFIFVAFEWTERDIKIDTSQAVAQIEFEEEMIPITQQEEKPAPPPVPVQEYQISADRSGKRYSGTGCPPVRC